MTIDDLVAQRFVRGVPFDIPEDDRTVEEYKDWFFNRIKRIVSVENHILKWRDVGNVLDLLRRAADEAGVTVTFSYEDGLWFMDGFQCKEDFQNLPVVAKIFGKLYRFQKPQKCLDKGEMRQWLKK